MLCFLSLSTDLFKNLTDPMALHFSWNIGMDPCKVMGHVNEEFHHPVSDSSVSDLIEIFMNLKDYNHPLTPDPVHKGRCYDDEESA